MPAEQATWDTVSFRSLCLETTTLDPTKSPDTVFEYVDVSSISNELWKIVSSTRHTGATAPSRARKVVRAEDVIFATVRPTLKRVALVPPELDGQVVSTAFCVLRADPIKADPRFIYYSLLTEDFINQVSNLERGASYPAVTDNDVLGREVSVPLLPEQRAIAAVLSKIQAAAEVQEKIVTTLKELKAATMAKLFREGLRGEPLKQTEIGEIPESWDVMRADAFCTTVTDGTHDTPKPTLDGPYLVTSKNLRNGSLDFTDSYRISEKDYDEIKRRSRVDPYDVIFGMIGTIGSPSLVTPGLPKFAIKNVGLFKTGNKTKGIWLTNYLRSDSASRLISNQMGGATQKYVPLWFLREFSIPVPKDDEMAQMAEMFETIDSKMYLTEQRQATLKSIFASMLHLLMTGQVRVSRLMETRNDLGLDGVAGERPQ